MSVVALIALCVGIPEVIAFRPPPRLEDLKAFVSAPGDSPLKMRAEFVLGVELQKATRPAEAVLPLSLALGQIPEIDDVVRYELGRALADAGKGAEAETVLSTLIRLFPDSDYAPLAEERLGQLEWARGAHKQALDRLAKQIAEGGDNARAVRLLQRQADWLLAESRAPEAAKVLKRIWIQYPEFEASLNARKRLEAMPGVGETLTLDDQLQRARALFALGHDEEAEAIWLAILADRQSGLDAGKRCQLLLRRANIAFRRKMPDVALELGEVVSSSQCAKQNIELRHDALKVVAKAQGQLLDFSHAAETYGKLVKESKKKNERRDLALLEAVVTRDAGNFAGADQRFTAFVRTYAKDQKALDARWFWGWMYYRLGHHDKAKAQWQAILKAHPRGSLTPRVNYWLGRMAELENNPAKAKELYTQVADNDAWAYYGYLARERLRGLGVEVVVSRGIDLQVPANWQSGNFPIHHRNFQRAVTLFELGFDAAAARALRGVPIPSNEKDAITLAELHHALDDDHRAQLIVRTRYDDELNHPDAPGELLALSYPRAFLREVSKFSEAYKVEPELVWSVMRQESTFKRDAVSSANAQGLLQLMPRTAQRMARELSQPIPSTFTEPTTNIQLGTAYIARLLESFGGHVGLAVAAYNAGPPAVELWLSRLREMPFDVWVEEVPFRETRDYVKKVIANYAAYRRIYKGEGTPLVGGLDRIPSASKGTIDF